VQPANRYLGEAGGAELLQGELGWERCLLPSKRQNQEKKELLS